MALAENRALTSQYRTDEQRTLTLSNENTAHMVWYSSANLKHASGKEVISVSIASVMDSSQ